MNKDIVQLAEDYGEGILELGSGGGGGTGGDDAIVFTQTASGDTFEYSCNKTLSEAIQLVGTVPIYFKTHDDVVYFCIRVVPNEAFLDAVFVEIYTDEGRIAMNHYQFFFDVNGVTCTITSN